ncbi:MAG: 4-cresol dehydrogenase (hydroxylating) [Crocinitomicaceae bacterium]|jgi:4-cresol dehydrogenase (hydroxylating)
MKNTLEKLFSEIGIELNIQTTHLQKNITEFASKSLLGVVCPKNKLEVEKIMHLANQHKIVLYPYSSGMNWGQGSKVPTSENSLLVDLSALKSIVEINEKHRYVIIEPGVTQQQLFETLKQSKFKVPVTGSAASSSVVGNMLERGATFFGHRNKLLMGVEVVLGNESTVRTGLWHFYKSDEKAVVYHAQGVGADINGLFTQSNFGIVTKIIVRLLPKREGFIVHAEAKEDKLIPLVDTLYELWEDGITQDGALITNKNDPRTTTKGNYSYTGDWFAVTTLSGATDTVTHALIEEAKKRLLPHCYHVDFLPTNSEDTNTHPFFSILNKLYHGEPTNYSLQTMAQMKNVELESVEELDTNKKVIGFSVALPAVPFDGEQVWKVMKIVKKVSDKLGVEPFHNFGSIGDKVFEGFYRIYFDRNDPDAIEKAHEWNEQVHSALEDINILPYRMNIERMPYFTQDLDDTFWQTIKTIKKALDPNQIIAVGRYSPI